MASNAWRWYLAGIIVYTQYYFVSAFGASPDGTLYTLLGVASIIAMVVGIAIHRPRHAVAWALVTVGVGLFLAGDFVYAGLAAEQAFVPFPSMADWLYLAMYPFVAVGLVVLGRTLAPRRSWSAVGVGLLCAVTAAGLLRVLYMGDYIAEPFFDTKMRVVAVAYPLLDAMMIGVAAWLAIISRRQSLSLTAMALALESLVVGNAIYNVRSIDGSYAAGGLAELFWIGFVSLLGVACLHPSMKATPRPSPVVELDQHAPIEPDSLLEAIERRTLLDLPTMPETDFSSVKPFTQV